MALRKLTASVWIQEQPLKFCGVEVGTRMTVIDLDGKGTLLVHSPSTLDASLRAEIEALGRVTCVVSPNKMHHLFIGEFRKAFPDAKFYCAPGLDSKRPDFAFNGVINNNQNFPWNPTLAHICFSGIPMYNEVVFLHPASRTLIITDLAVHICESESLITRIALRLLGAYGNFGWSKIEKLIFIRNRPEFHKSMNEVLSWDFDRIVLSHGTLIESGGKARLAQAFHN